MDTKILELSPFEDTVSSALYPDAQVERFDPFLPVPEEFFGKYDGVMANNVLQRFNYMASLTVMKSWAACLKEGGELHVIVPSLEWAAREVLSESPSPVCMMVMYGAQGGDGSIHTSGYTMRLLRAHFSKCGLYVHKARTGDADIEVGGKVYKFHQHYVSGTKGLPDLKKE